MHKQYQFILLSNGRNIPYAQGTIIIIKQVQTVMLSHMYKFFIYIDKTKQLFIFHSILNHSSFISMTMSLSICSRSDEFVHANPLHSLHARAHSSPYLLQMQRLVLQLDLYLHLVNQT